MLTLVVVAKNHADLRSFDLSHVEAAEIVLVANTDRRSLSSIGNHYLECARTRVLGLAHADCFFGPDSIRRFTETAAADKVCGIVGLDLDLNYRWSRHNPGPVSTLDSCSVFLRRDTGLRFDERLFDSLHLHVEDICLQAHRAGLEVVVPDADATHRSSTTNGAGWLEEYHRYRNLLVRKWAGTTFTTT